MAHSESVAQMRLCKSGCGRRVLRQFAQGHAGRVVIDYTGKKFGTIEVLYRLKDKAKCGNIVWLCRCICGNTYKKTRPERGMTCLKCRGYKPFESLFNRLGHSGKHHVSITFSQFLEFTKIKNCHYCSAPIAWVSRATAEQKASRCNLDRKDSAKGYSKNNCVVCCTRCNRAKNNHFTYEEWMQIGDLIRSWPM